MNAPARPRILQSPGPICEAFVRSRAFIKICIGPVGSGKTIGMLTSGLQLAARQRGVKGAGGVIRSQARIGVMRESYPALKSTTVKSWHRIVPEQEGDFNWSAPYTHKFSKILARDTQTNKPKRIGDFEFEFRAIGEQSVEEACRSWEISGALVEELDLQPASLVPFLTGRVGRYSELDPSLVVDPQIAAVMNMPEIEHSAYELAMSKTLDGMSSAEQKELEEALDGRPLIETFIQPGGMEPDAENLHNLPGGRRYYILQIAANKHVPGYVDRMVHNKPVPMMHGKPVNQGFVFTRHVRECQWDKGRKLIVGIDAKQTAAAVFLQRTATGGVRTLGEVVNRSRDGKTILAWSAQTFGRMLRLAILERFPGIREENIRLVCDPSAFKGKNAAQDEHDWVKTCEGALKFGKIHKAKSNAASLRNEAIWQAQDRQDGYYVDPSCKHLIKAHAGGYRYEKSTLQTGEEKGALVIANTIYTHVADAEQYAALEGEHVISDIHGKARPDPGARVVVEGEYDEFSFSGG